MSAAQAERTTLRLMGLAGFASMASARLCDPMLVVLGQEFQITTGEASRAVSFFAVAYGVMQLFYGPLGDRFGKLRVISLAVLACALFSVITSMTTDLNLLIVMRAFMGAAAAGIIPLSMAWSGDRVPYDRRQETLARLMGATVSGMMLGLWFGGFAAEHWGWRSAFVVMSGLFGVAALLLLRQVRGLPAAEASNTSGFVAYFVNTAQMLRIRRVQQVCFTASWPGAGLSGWAVSEG